MNDVTAVARRTFTAAVVCVLALSTAPARAHEVPVVLQARADAAPISRLNPRLVGVGWDRAPFTPERMAPLRPNLVRIDGSLENLYPRGPALDDVAFDALAQDVAEALDIGGEPVVILSYTPVWLGDERPSSDRTKVPPADASVWRGLVVDVVTRLSVIGVRWFEVWNEPDLPVFFQGLLPEFLEGIYRPSAEAVMEVERRSGRDLRFGGCACFFPDPAWMIPMILYARGNGLPLDFLSWHHYGNTPFLGPDGAEPLGPPEFRPVLAALRQRNPVTSPAAYADQVEAVRGWRDALYPDGEPQPELWIDEWNLAAGGFDHRHDTTEGAAFQAAVLTELQRAGLDRASVFRSVDPAYGPDIVPANPELYGGWGLVGREGTIKPAWRAHRFWRELAGDVLAFTSPADARLGVSGVLTRRSERRFVALVSNFQASNGHGHHLELRLDGAAEGRWTLRVLSLDGARRTSMVVSRGRLAVPIDLDSQTGALVDLRLRS